VPEIHWASVVERVKILPLNAYGSMTELVLPHSEVAMARTVKVHLVDDIDGSVADETVKFSLDGTSYEIDLSFAHSDEFRKALAKFIVAGRRPTTGIVTGRRPVKGSGSASADKAQNAAIREWARSMGIELNGRGRIPHGIVERYEREKG
jgi:hypothetical protein